MRRIVYALLLAAVAGCGPETQPTQPVSAHVLAPPAPHREYLVVKLPSLGGTSLGTGISNGGLVAGFSNVSASVRHAALWRDGGVIDLGTLGGRSSNSQWPGLSNGGGRVVGISYTSTPDTLDEDWSCDAFMPVSDSTCVGFVWENGVMTPLPTFGGDNGFATGVNSRGQIVGWAETRVLDPTCNAPQKLQFRAALWDRKAGTMRELRPLHGDSTTAATAINERGQVVGISGDCDVAVGRFSARHAVVWEHGRPTDIGNLGGISWHTPMEINASGDIVGFSNPPGDVNGEFFPHAFVWTKASGIKDLGLLPDHDFSQAFSINARRQVVGRSCGANGCLAVLWDRGGMIDLNSLAELDDGDVLLSARDINDAGQITGNVFEASTRRTLAFVATPRAARH